jgi:TolB-like protein/Tfp pilus assembly protein PilF
VAIHVSKKSSLIWRRRTQNSKGPSVSTEQPGLRFEIGHVLFIDIVGYSRLFITEQSELLRKLTAMVVETEQFRIADAEGKLVRLPTGDGMALVFRTSPEAPAQCAVELSKRLKSHPKLPVRMGIHSGPVNEVADVNERINITGAGINIAQRVMDCGDAGHILLSKHVADDLEQYPQWREHLHELGQVEVKHGVKLDIVNFYNDEAGNPELPQKFKQAAKAERLAVKRRRRQMFAGAVLLVAIASSLALWTFFRSGRPAAGLPVSDKSIAVLPFENLSDEKENAYFADGVHNEILTDLARIADLKVISRTSVLIYKAGVPRNLREIGQQLGVTQVLEGSVQRAAGKIRVNAQLIDARTDKHLWAKTYDRDLADVFTIETEVAQAIANELQAKLSAAEKASIAGKPTQDLAAYDFYIRATPLVDEISLSSNPAKDLSTAVDLLNQAIARDPSFLLAYYRLALAHDSIYFQNIDHTPARLALAQSAIDSVFRLKPDSGEGHLALASHLYYGSFDYEGSRAELAIAQRTLPNNPEIFALLGYIDRRQGRWSEAVRNMERASELDPRNIFKLTSLAGTYWQLRDYEREDNTLARILALDPSNAVARIWRAFIAVDQRADTRRVHTEIEKVLAQNPALAQGDDIKRPRFYLALVDRNFAAADRTLAALPERNSFGDDFEFSRYIWAGVVARMKGDAAAARAAFTAARAEHEPRLQRQPDFGLFVGVLAVIDAGLGRKEESLHEGRRAVELVPLAKNSLHGMVVLTDFCIVCAWIGERDLAFEQLEALAKIPGGPSYGDLRLNPIWDPLRGDARFDKIVASLAPKDAKQ